MTLPVVDPPSELPRPDATVAGVLLAAGTSSRYGEPNKLLEPVDGEPMVRRSARTLLAADLDSVTVVVVVGHDADRVRDALDDLGVSVVRNPDYESGQASSVRAGVDALDGEAVDAAVFALGDMPYVDPASIDALVETFAATGRSALAAGCGGDRGNPVLFAAEHFDALAAVSGDTGGRSVLLDAPDAAVVETGDSGVLRDVDRPGEFA